MLSSIDGNNVKTVWHKKFFDASKSRLSDSEYQAIINELNRIIQKSVDEKTNVVVSSFIPGSDWSGTVWEPIYSKACGYDEECSAKFFGLLACQALIDRKETWYFIKQDVARGMLYFKEKTNGEKQRNKKQTKSNFSIDDLKNKFGE